MDIGYENMPSRPIGQMLPKKKDIDIGKLINEALAPSVWKDHVVKDLMKFWDTPEATELQGGLFPTYRTNAGGTLPKNKEEWPEEFKQALLFI